MKPPRMCIIRPYSSLLVTLLLSACLLPGCKREDPQVARAANERQGDDLAAAEKFGQAVDAYQRAVNAAPDDGLLRVKLAKAHEQAGQWTSAADQAMRAADVLPNDYDAQFLAARLILGQSRFDDSLKITTRLLRQRPDDPELLVLWGTATARLINPTWALFKLGATGGTGPDYQTGCTNLRPRVGPEDDQRAEAALRKAVAAAPASVDAQLALINFLWAARRADDSRDLIKALADEQPSHGLVMEIAGHFFLARNDLALGEKYLAQAADATASYSRAARLALADHFAERGQYADALAHLDKMLPADDEGGVIAARRAELQIRLDRHDVAAKELDAILARYPKHRRGLTLKATLLMKQHRAADALVVARDAVAADLTSGDARVVLADALAASGDRAGAFAEYGEALRLEPSLTHLAPRLAQLALATGNTREALTYARLAIRLFPDDMAPKVAEVTAQVRLGDYAAAATALDPLLRLRPRPAAVSVQLGLMQAGRGNAAAARAAFDSALKTDPDALEALAGLVDLDLARGQTAEARQRVEAMLARRPDEPGVLKLASRVYRAQGDLAGAEKVLRRALGLQPADVETSLLLADALAASGRDDGARQLLDQVLARHPESPQALTALGAVLERLGRSDEAEVRYKSVLAAHPGNAPAAVRLALLHAARGQSLDVALGHLSDAKRASPDDPAISDALGWVYVQKNLRLLAIEHLEEAVALRPSNPQFQHHLGVAYARAGSAAKARAALTRALALDAGYSGRREVETALASLDSR